jgi:hypothetical protein
VKFKSGLSRVIRTDSDRYSGRQTLTAIFNQQSFSKKKKEKEITCCCYVRTIPHPNWVRIDQLYLKNSKKKIHIFNDEKLFLAEKNSIM